MSPPEQHIDPAIIATQVHVTSAPAEQDQFTAFISYRRKDASRVAHWLRNRLTSYTPPKALLEMLGQEQRSALNKRRSYYLDTAYAKANEDFWVSNIEPALQKSKYLIVISSPAAFEPRPDGSENWVAREIRRFHTIHSDIRRITLALAPGAVEDIFPATLAKLSDRWDWADFRGYTSGLWRWINLPRAFKLDAMSFLRLLPRFLISRHISCQFSDERKPGVVFESFARQSPACLSSLVHLWGWRSGLRSIGGKQSSNAELRRKTKPK
jgi:hypothetical protein